MRSNSTTFLLMCAGACYVKCKLQMESSILLGMQKQATFTNQLQPLGESRQPSFG